MFTKLPLWSSDFQFLINQIHILLTYKLHYQSPQIDINSIPHKHTDKDGIKNVYLVYLQKISSQQSRNSIK